MPPAYKWWVALAVRWGEVRAAMRSAIFCGPKTVTFAKSDHIWDQKNGTSSGQIFSAPALFCSGGFILPLEASKECGLSTDQRLDCSIIGINRRSSSLQLVATWRHHDASELVCTSSKFKARKLPLMSCFEFHTLVSHNYALRTHFFYQDLFGVSCSQVANEKSKILILMMTKGKSGSICG